MLRVFFGQLRQPTMVLKAYPQCNNYLRERRLGHATDLTYCYLFTFWYYMGVFEDSGPGLLLRPTDDAVIVSKEFVLFINTRVECCCC
jgi:hypothetical protein